MQRIFLSATETVAGRFCNCFLNDPALFGHPHFQRTPYRQIQRRRRGISVAKALQTISSSVGAAYFDVAPDGAENDVISILQICRADGAAEETTTSAKAQTCEAHKEYFKRG
jgi:hypothetical protein